MTILQWNNLELQKRSGTKILLQRKIGLQNSNKNMALDNLRKIMIVTYDNKKFTHKPQKDFYKLLKEMQELKHTAVGVMELVLGFEILLNYLECAILFYIF